MRRNCSSKVWARTWPSLWSPATPPFCTDMTFVLLISSSAALSFSSWLQATHTSVAYRLVKPKFKHDMKTVVIACEIWISYYSEVASSFFGSVVRPTMAWERQLGFHWQSSWIKFQIPKWLLKFRTSLKWYESFVEWNWQVDVKVLKEKEVPK